MRLVYQIDWKNLAGCIFSIYSPFIWAIVFLMIASYIKKTSNGQRKTLIKIMTIYVLIFCGISHIFSLFVGYLEITNIYLPYKSGCYESVYGEVSDFYTSTVVESFQVNGVEFKYSAKDIFAMEYNIIEEKGGYIHEDSKNIRIDYILYNEKNVIVAIYEGE